MNDCVFIASAISSKLFFLQKKLMVKVLLIMTIPKLLKSGTWFLLNLTEKDNGGFSGMLNYRVNNEHTQKRFK